MKGTKSFKDRSGTVYATMLCHPGSKVSTYMLWQKKNNYGHEKYEGESLTPKFLLMGN